MAKLFFSYAHADESLRDELQKHLEPLKRSGIIETWHDRMIRAGDEFDGVIDGHLETADVILLLVSSDFLFSKYCNDVEVKRAMERHEAGTARVIPVILRPCDWMHDTPFRKLLAAPKDGRAITLWPNQDEAFVDVVRQIREAVKSSPTPPTPEAVASPASVTLISDRPRSSNLRLRRTFTEADQDRFMDESFEYMAKFFEGSLEELKRRNPGIDAAFKRIDAECFTAVIYRNGEAVARCAVSHGGASPFGSGIAYAAGAKGRGNGFNEILSVEAGEHSLSLKSMGMSGAMFGEDRQTSYSQQGAAELYWAMLMEPLQRE